MFWSQSVFQFFLEIIITFEEINYLYIFIEKTIFYFLNKLL